MILLLITTFLIIVVFLSLIYISSGEVSADSSPSPEATSTYACGERLSVGRIVVDPTLYHYSIYFLIFDSGIVLLAFGSQTLDVSAVFAVIYLLISVISVLLLPSVTGKIKKV